MKIEIIERKRNKEYLTFSYTVNNESKQYKVHIILEGNTKEIVLDAMEKHYEDSLIQSIGRDDVEGLDDKVEYDI